MRKNWSGEAARNEDGNSKRPCLLGDDLCLITLEFIQVKPTFVSYLRWNLAIKDTNLICLKQKLDIYSHLASYLKIMYIWLYFLWKTSFIRYILILKHAVLIENFFSSLLCKKKIDFFFSVFTQDWKMYSQNRFVWFYAQVAELLS